MSYESSMPSFEITKHYLKDLSVENPHGTIIFDKNTTLLLDFTMSLEISMLDEHYYEVILQAEAKHIDNDQTDLFCELSYVLEVQMNDIPDALIEKMLNIDVPQLGYPIVESIIRQNALFSGFASVEIQPVDLEAMFKNSEDQSSELA